MNSKRNKLIAILLLFVTNGPAQAIIVGAGQFDQLIKNAKIIVKGRVTPMDESPFEMITFKVEIITVLKNDGAAIPNQLQIEAPFPIWPKDFNFPFTKNQVVLLVLERLKDDI